MKIKNFASKGDLAFKKSVNPRVQELLFNWAGRPALFKLSYRDSDRPGTLSGRKQATAVPYRPPRPRHTWNTYANTALSQTVADNL